MTTSVRASVFYKRSIRQYENVQVGYEIETDEFLPGEKIDDVKNRLKAKVEGWVEDHIREIDAEAR